MSDIGIGDVLAGRYRLTAILGEGGMGAVYEATQIDLGRPVAVKLMLPQAGQHQDAIARFEREARVTAALHHPGAVKIFDFGRHGEGLLYIVMEKLRGTTLRSVVSPELPIPALARSVSIGRQIADVLVAAHGIGLVHRDLKPENVFLEKNLDGSDRVVVVDFGLAYIEDRPDAARMTKEGVIAGTPLYMSPEQCAGKGIGTAADVYALGCMLYELACGEVPFEGASFQLLVRHSFEEPVPPSRRKEGLYVPRALEELILEMMRKAPEARPDAAAVDARLGTIEVTLGERERGRGREALEGRAARMIPTVRAPLEPLSSDAATPAPNEASARMLGIVGALEDDLVLGLRANGLPPLELHGPPIAPNVVAIFAPGAPDDLLRTLLGFGLPVLTDGDPDDLERATRMISLGLADVLPRPIRVEQLASKIERAIRKHGRRSR